jgi:glucosamine--fructose-6-phosphate aminotransferase (isomerizing)
VSEREAGATRMFREAAEAPQAVRRQIAANRERMAALGHRLRSLSPRAVVTCARGSSDHAATYAKYLLETRLGVLTSSAAPSVSSVYRSRQDLSDCLFLAISQSGRSPDLLVTTRAAREAGAFVVAMVNAADSPLAELADEAIPLGAGEEKSVAATKSYIASLAAVAHLASEWSGDEHLRAALTKLPDQLGLAWDLDWGAACPMLASATNLFVMARGVGLAVAQEAALKLKETCGLHAEAFSGAEVRHGPQALLGAAFPALVLAQDDAARPGLEALANDLVARGVPVACAGVRAAGAVELPTVACDPAVAPLLLAQAFYRLANAVAIARGRDPDDPPHLSKVTETH